MGNTPRPAETGITPGMIFLGKYRVDEILGQGGMGIVAACTHLALNERVAIKMLRADVLLDRDAVERFMREAQAAVKLRSEYVARVTDVGTTEDNVPYMVMEYLDGHDLGELIDQRGCLPYPWATELILQACEALSEAHSLGIVHRDVKPTNLFVTWRPDGSALIKVLDFGISKAPMGTDMQLTQTQSLLGTPAYMSPEQMRSARMVDARTDIWSLGTVMYELLEGRRPFEAESFSEMCVKVAVDAPSPMVNTPPALQQVVLRCLAKSPEQRYPNMAELGRELIPFAQDTHQAQMLVDRMTRMLGRRAGDWDGGTNSGIRSQPGLKQIRDAQSGGLRTPVPAWHGGSDPSGAVFVARPRQDATPAVTEPVRITKRKPWPVFVALAIVIGVGAGLVIALTGGTGVPAPIAADPAPARPTEPTANPTTEQPVAIDDAERTAAEQATAEKAAAEQATAQQAVVEPTAEKRPGKPPIKRPTKPVKPTKPDRPKDLKEPVKEPVKEPPPKPRIDPFATPRPSEKK